MVGVAGRSKACGTCRQRRIRCTFERPHCANCIRSNRACSGYERERVFFVNQARHPGTFPKGKGQQQDWKDKEVGADRSSDGHASEQGEACMDVLIPKSTSKAKRKSTPMLPSPDDQALIISPTSAVPALATCRQQLLALYLSTTIPSPADLGPGPLPWITHLALLPHHPPCLAAAIDALTLSHLARLATPPPTPPTQPTPSDRSTLLAPPSTSPTNSDDNALSFRAQSLRAYTDGLWHLQRALWSPAEQYDDTTLAACLVLALYELLECPGGSRVGYLAHQGGAARLVLLRGARAHRVKQRQGDDAAFAHALFVAFRNQRILRALERHEAGCFLAEEEWCREPWEVEGEKGMAAKKGKEEEIWDFIALTPGVLARTDVMQRAKPVRSLCIALEVLEFCWETDGALDRWLEGFREGCGGCLYWPVLAEDQDEAGSEVEGECHDLFPVRFEFLNLRVALTLMNYWSLLTVARNGVMLLYQALQTVPVDRKAIRALGDRAPTALLRGISVDCPPDCACGGEPDVPCLARFDISTMPPLDYRADFMTPVRNICQSVYYCSQPKMRSFGFSSVIAPLGIAVDVIKDYPWCERERDWMLDVLRSKMPALPYLKNIWWAGNKPPSASSSDQEIAAKSGTEALRG